MGCTTLIKAVITHRVFDTFCDVLEPWLAEGVVGQPVLHAAMGLLLRLIHNLLVYSSENTGKLRQHIATQSKVVSSLALPYLRQLLAHCSQSLEPGLQGNYLTSIKLGNPNRTVAHC